MFQLYSVYTKKLDEYSAASFLPERAPEFILLEWNAIDGRNMFLDTPALWNAVLPNYHILKSDNKRLLLQKNDVYKTLTFTPAGTEICTWNKTIAVPQYNENGYAKITVTPSGLGKIITFVFRGSPPKITLATKDGAYTYRAITDTLQTPALVSRVPDNFEQMKSLFAGEAEALPAVTELRFTSAAPFMYKKEITVEYFRAEE